MDELKPGEPSSTQPDIAGVDNLVFLGRGGMSTVYKAHDKVLDRAVAIKVLNCEKEDSSELFERFSVEVKILASLKHPNIVGVQRYGVNSADSPYLIMDYVEGMTLRDFVAKNGNLSANDFCAIFSQVLSALAEAQQKGIVHRDMKPENIMISIVSSKSAVGGAEPPSSCSLIHVTLLDFGVAKILVGKNVDLTKTGVTIGTPKYMSPEQLTGKPVDHRSDLYAVAAVMYETVFGKAPFESDVVSEAIYRKLNEAPETLFAKVHSPRISAQFKAFLLKALATMPESRFQSANEMQDALNALPAGFLASPRQNNSIAKSLIFLISTVLLLLIPVYVYFSNTVKHSAQIKSPALSERQVRTIIDQCQKLRAEKRGAEALRQLKRAYSLLGTDQSNRTLLLRSNLLLELVPLQQGLDAIDTCNELLPILDKLKPSDSTRVSVRAQLAQQYHGVGRQREAVKTMETCEQLIMSVVPMKPVYLWRARTVLVVWYLELGEVAKSKAKRQQLWTQMESIRSFEDPGERAELMLELIKSWVSSGELDVARQKMKSSAPALIELILADQRLSSRGDLLKRAEELCSGMQLPGVAKKFHDAQSEL
ncbi:MAG: serine/threonine protein kinase [Candidatus Obscuribacterales bacterium]|nr:serine/threonine protein kinase [Candidatus Obscuribacterales bacterium]